MKFPVTVRFRRATAKIYGRTAGNDSYRVAFYAGGERKLRSFGSYADARAEAERLVRLVHNDDAQAATLTSRDAHTYRTALERLRLLDADLAERGARLPEVTLGDAIAEYAEAKRLLGGTRLVEAVQGYLSTIATVRSVRVSIAVEEFIKERERQTLPPAGGGRPPLAPKFHYQQTLHLRRFAAAFQMDVRDISRDGLTLYFGEGLKKLRSKTRNHHKATLRLWLKWCVDHDYLPSSHRLLETPCLKTERCDPGAVVVYSARELATLLEHSSGALRAMIAIGGFAGLRTEELLRLDWAEVWRRRGFIEVGTQKAKTRKRRLVPITPALASWLEEFQSERQGPVWPDGGESRFQKEFTKLTAKVGISRRKNALRHGYISYQLALIHNEHAVAGLTGTSPALIHTNYRELVTAAEAQEYFAVVPQARVEGGMPIGGAVKVGL